MPGSANSVGLRIHGFFLHHLRKEVSYAIAFNKYLITLKSIEGVCYFMPSIHPSLTTPLIYETYKI
jgi:hypothetical protein